jgi:hypothetical protein
VLHVFGVEGIQTVRRVAHLVKKFHGGNAGELLSECLVEAVEQGAVAQLHRQDQ